MTMSRREFLKATAVAVVATALPVGSALAQGSAKYRRLNVSDPKATRVLNSYKKAIRAMLALPPTDPRNWYRIAIIHTLDCPHGNWWFLPWHRAYIGWFEQICRELSGDQDFALPYWDWTQNLDPTRPPSVPNIMFDGVLTPTDKAYIAKVDKFKTQFKGAVSKASYWKRIDTTDGKFDEDTQFGQLLIRGIRSDEDLWFDINSDPRWKLFYDLTHARGLTKDKPWFDEKTTKAVSLQTLLDALSPRDFITFGSPKTLSHSGLTGFGVLEGQPHNRVHNNVGGISTVTDAQGQPIVTDVGGFMQENLSPVDPLFFLHHANIDRLWDVWTRKQQAQGYPILPDGYLLPPRRPPTSPFTDFEMWSKEPFLFFVDAKGQPVSKKTAGDYATIGDFKYDYQPGSGEEIVPKVATAAPAPKVQAFVAKMDNKSVTSTKAASGSVAIPSSLLRPATEPNARALFATVTIALPTFAHGNDYKVVVNGPADPASVGPSSPYYVATLSMFGHHTMRNPVAFTVPLSRALVAMGADKLTGADTSLNIQVVRETTAMLHSEREGMMAQFRAVVASAEVHSIVVEVR